jgi:hypothetical protein
MSDLVNGEFVSGTCFHVKDCYVWAEIYYLDSPTDYRECLPKQRAGSVGELIMLDSSAGALKHVKQHFAAMSRWISSRRSLPRS